MDNKDMMIRAMAEDQILAFAVYSRQMAETARVFHNTSPVATAALGRLLSGTVMMGSMLKNEDDKITVQITGDGPLGGILVTADAHGHAKGYVNNPYVLLPAKPDGHFDIGGAVGKGSLSVIKDMGLKDTYNGHVPLYSGEIAEDLTHYFMTSEQTPSSVGLGVLVSKEDMSVKHAGGFIIQLLPNASDAVIEKLENNIKDFGYVTDRLSEDSRPEYLLELLLKDMSFEITERKPVEFLCECSRDRVRRAIALLGEVEVASMIRDNKPVELNCQFCNKSYRFDVDELIDLSERRPPLL